MWFFCIEKYGVFLFPSFIFNHHSEKENHNYIILLLLEWKKERKPARQPTNKQKPFSLFLTLSLSLSLDGAGQINRSNPILFFNKL